MQQVLPKRRFIRSRLHGCRNIVTFRGTSPTLSFLRIEARVFSETLIRCTLLSDYTASRTVDCKVKIRRLQKPQISQLSKYLTGRPVTVVHSRTHRSVSVVRVISAVYCDGIWIDNWIYCSRKSLYDILGLLSIL